MSARDRLLIIGAGPKALAIAAKSQVLAELGLPAPQVHIIEKQAVGAHWTGRFGYTNGRLRLGTLPDKDIGFPYQSDCWSHGSAVNERMARYSWHSFLIAERALADWVDRGRPAPEHRQWARYLQWVADSLGEQVTIEFGEVTALTLRNGRWRLCCRGRDGRESHPEGDGIVFTGPGKARWPGTFPSGERVLSMESCWRIDDLLRGREAARIAVVGAGESAASIAVALAERKDPGLRVEIISRTGAIYSRGESFQENLVYSNPEAGAWQMLSMQDRRRFIQRTDRGVFSLQAQSIINVTDNVGVVPGRLRNITLAGDRVEVELEYDRRTYRHSYDFLVHAIGFDQASLLRELLDPPATREVLRRTGLKAITDPALERIIGLHLDVRGLSPRLHLPMLSGMSQGPGFANLSCLGRLSDRILSAYRDLHDLRGASERRARAPRVAVAEGQPFARSEP